MNRWNHRPSRVVTEDPATATCVGPSVNSSVSSSIGSSVSSSVGSSVRRPREGFLDTIRTIATIRVIFWHAFGTPFLSFLVASMPTMFFVAGSLFAASLDRKSFRVVLRDRLRRILIPFWVFGAFCLTVFAIARVAIGGPETVLRLSDVVGWMFPVLDPKGNAWSDGWLSNPLWYLRALFWLMLLTPVLRAAYRRFGTWVFGPPVAAVFVIDLLIRRTEVPIPFFNSWRWYVGDLALYSVFWMLGFLHREGRFALLSRRAKLEWCVIASVCAAIWCTTQPIIGGVVNNSYPAHLFVGGAWLFAFLVAEPFLGRVPNHRLLGPVVKWMTRRSLTVYLWHTTAIVCADTVLRTVVPAAPRLLIIPMVVVLVPIAALLFGWVEDYAAGRPPKLWPTPLSFPTVGRTRVAAALLKRTNAVAATTRPFARKLRRSWLGRVRSRDVVSASAGWLAAMSMLVVAPSATLAAQPAGSPSKSQQALGRRAPAPSARPETAVFALTDESTPPAENHENSTSVPSASAATSTAPTPAASAATSSSSGSVVSPASARTPVDDATAARLQAALNSWLTELQVQGASVTVSLADGTRWVGSGGNRAADEVIEVTSATKSFTAALILRLADQGLISLDAPLPDLAQVPTFPKGTGITPRQLLNHTSGLATYQDSPEYMANPGMVLTPATAVGLAAAQPLLWAPGKNSGYSSSGYLTLGLLAEQVTGKTLKQLFQDEFFTPLGLKQTQLDALPPVDGWIGWSTGGITTDMNDLATWGVALLRDKSVLSKDSTVAMMDVSNDWSVGLGLWPVCPCSLGANGQKVYTSIGHNGGSGTYQYSPQDGSVIAAFITEPIFNSRVTQQDLYQLLASLRQVASGTSTSP